MRILFCRASRRVRPTFSSRLRLRRVYLSCVGCLPFLSTSWALCLCIVGLAVWECYDPSLRGYRWGLVRFSMEGQLCGRCSRLAMSGGPLVRLGIRAPLLGVPSSSPTKLLPRFSWSTRAFPYYRSPTTSLLPILLPGRLLLEVTCRSSSRSSKGHVFLQYLRALASFQCDRPCFRTQSPI